MKNWRIETLEELQIVAKEVLAHAEHQSGTRVLALSGELGAGKTVFVQELAKLLGISDTVTSPTFVLMRTYQTAHPAWTKLVHIDAYRFEEVAEAEVLRIPDIIAEEGVFACIEWPERIAGLMPTTTEKLSFVLHEDGTRSITHTPSM